MKLTGVESRDLQSAQPKAEHTLMGTAQPGSSHLVGQIPHEN